MAITIINHILYLKIKLIVTKSLILTLNIKKWLIKIIIKDKIIELKFKTLDSSIIDT